MIHSLLYTCLGLIILFLAYVAWRYQDDKRLDRMAEEQERQHGVN